MAYQGLMCKIIILFAVSIHRIQVTGVEFGSEKTSRACYGTFGLECTQNKLNCGNKKLLISNVSYSGEHSGKCFGVANCESFEAGHCCIYEYPISDALESNRLQIYQKCSGHKSCEETVTSTTLVTGRVTATTITYYCIGKGDILEFCESTTKKRSSVHIIYDGSRDNYTNTQCRCNLSGQDFKLYSVDIRLQNHQNTTSCTGTTLKWGVDEIRCRKTSDHVTLVEPLNTEIDHVQLNIGDENPTMAWVVAKATKGKVTVTCSPQKADTQSTTVIAAPSNKTLTPHVSLTQSYINLVTSPSIPPITGDTTIPNKDDITIPTTDDITIPTTEDITIPTTDDITIPTTDDTTVPVSYATGRNGYQTGSTSGEETNIGAIVGPVSGILIIAVLAGIAIVFAKRRRAKQEASKNTTVLKSGSKTCPDKADSENETSEYDIISEYEQSKPDVALSSVVTEGTPNALNSATSYTQIGKTRKSDEVENNYSDLNPLTMMTHEPRVHDNFKSEYNHLDFLKIQKRKEGTNNVYSHLKANNTNNSRNNDDYDHFDGGPPTSLDHTGQALSSDNYDHFSRPKLNNVTGCTGAHSYELAQPMTAGKQDTECNTDYDHHSNTSNVISYELAQPITSGRQDTGFNTDYDHPSNTNNVISYEMAYPLNSDKGIIDKNGDYDHLSGFSVNTDTSYEITQPIIVNRLETPNESDYDHLSRP